MVRTNKKNQATIELLLISFATIVLMGEENYGGEVLFA